MNKVSALVLALVAMLAVGGIAANAANKKQRIGSKVSLQFEQGGNGSPYYEEAAFTGKVQAKGKASRKAKRACRKRRTVVLTQVGAGQFGQVETNGKGRFRLSASDAYNAPGRYTATALRKKKGKIVCKKATSTPVEAF